MINSSKKTVQKIFSYKIVRYGLIGGISTLIHFSSAFLYIYTIDSSVVQANIVGFLIAYLFSYTVQSKYVFEHTLNFNKALKYFIVQFTALILAIGLSTLFESYNSYLKTVIVVIVLPLITYLIHTFWTFNKGKS